VEIVYAAVVLGWPLFMLAGMVLTGDLELPERVRDWLNERAWRRYEHAQLLAEQVDFLFDPHWCVYQLEGLEPRLLWAVPRSAAPIIQNLLGPAMQPSSPWLPRQGAVHYPWKPVPAYVDRSLGATAAWFGRQEIGAWL
jgi:hypothetical protein